jgi:hypothetical protein
MWGLLFRSNPEVEVPSGKLLLSSTRKIAIMWDARLDINH